MKETQICKHKRLIIALMGAVVLISIVRAGSGIDANEVWRMITLSTQCVILFTGIIRMRFGSFTRVETVYTGNEKNTGRFDMILLGSFAMLQPNDPTQIPSTTIVLVIGMILFLFLVCPFLIGKILSQPEWTEEEEAMGAELPQWEARDTWADLFPRYLTGEMDGSNRSEAAHKK
jgi:hypothetical protein